MLPNPVVSYHVVYLKIASVDKKILQNTENNQEISCKQMTFELKYKYSIH